eukprot:5156137-Pleurochrysis_carterae.AAC.4
MQFGLRRPPFSVTGRRARAAAQVCAQSGRRCGGRRSRRRDAGTAQNHTASHALWGSWQVQKRGKTRCMWLWMNNLGGGWSALLGA